jgi:hypothetical protein
LFPYIQGKSFSNIGVGSSGEPTIGPHWTLNFWKKLLCKVLFLGRDSDSYRQR